MISLSMLVISLVALLTECVDRNIVSAPLRVGLDKSHSLRSAWIEIQAARGTLGVTPCRTPYGVRG